MAHGEGYNNTRAFSFLSKVSDEKPLQIKEITKAVKKLRYHSYFLDIGAGAGDIFFDIARHFKESVAIEPGKKMLKIFKEKKRNQKAKGVKVVSKRWEEFYAKYGKKYAGHFDLITSVHSIYFLGDKVKEVKNMLKLLNKDGLLVLIYGYSRNPKNEFVSKFRHDFSDKPYHHNEAYESIKNHFRKNLRTKFIETKFVLQDFKDLEENHMSDKSAPTNYFLQFAIKKWFDELTRKQKESLLKYLNPLKKRDKYIIGNTQVVQIIRKT